MEQRLSNTIIFPICKIDKAIADIIPTMRKSTCWPAFNALKNLNRAWKIREIDPEMAIFRGKTAEEEAATAVFASLEKCKYNNAKKLNKKNHVQKNALIPFIGAINKLRVYHKIKFKLILYSEHNPPLLTLSSALDQNTFYNPKYGDPPLDFKITKPGQKDVLFDFSHQLIDVAKDVNTKNIKDYIEKRANKRNQILYAVEGSGCPEFSGDITKVLTGHISNVFTILKIYLMIDQYKKPQIFAQQCLDSFLKMIGKLPTTQFD